MTDHKVTRMNSRPQRTPTPPNDTPTVGTPTLPPAAPSTTASSGAREAAKALAYRNRPLPFRSLCEHRGMWRAEYVYFEQPQWATLRDQLAKYGYRLRAVSSDGQQTTTWIDFVEAT